MSATIKDIAEATGLGLATISKYINGGNVLEKNREKIEKAIKDLDFHVNGFARSLKTSKSRTVGVVIPELSNTFSASIITVIEDILRRAGYGILVCDCRTDERLECEAVSFLMEKMVDGIISMPVSRDGAHLKQPIAEGIPIVLIDRNIEALSVDAVLIDNERASAQAVDCLLASGHHKIGIICGSDGIYTTHERLRGYKQSFLSKGLEPDDNLVEYGNYTVQGGYESMKKLLDKHVTAIFVTNYEMTLGAIIAINELGVRIPEELSFIGFDNLQLSQIVKPRLSIIYQPLEQIADDAARLIIERLLKNDGRPACVIKHATTLLRGESIRNIQ